MSAPRGSAPIGLLLAGAAALAAWSVARLPPPAEILRAPETPYEHSDVRYTAGPTFLFLTRVGPFVPRGATVTIYEEPRDPGRDGNLFEAGVALLPGRRVLPAAQWGAFTPEDEAAAEYVVIQGTGPAVPPGRLVGALEKGTIWRRHRPSPLGSTSR